MPDLYPLRFAPIFKSMLWGGTRLRPYFGDAASSEATGEAWVLSDVDGSPSVVRNGPLAGRTLRDLLAAGAAQILGSAPLANGRFPLLLKFLDAKQELSVQVHPNDEQARAKDPRAAGKTEAWVILAADASSRIYAGFREGTTAASFRAAMANGTVPETLHTFAPKPGDGVFLRAGTVHAIGANLLVFEVQQTSDITYRLFDWNRVDAKTGLPRQLHIDDGLACANFAAGPCPPVTPRRDGDRDLIAACEYFTLHHRHAAEACRIGAANRCTAVVCVAGVGTLAGEPLRAGDVVLLPASVGTADLVPAGSVRLLECSPWTSI